MYNVVTVIFEVENEAYRAFSEVRNNMLNSSCVVAQLTLIKKKDGRITIADGADSGITTADDTQRGGLIGLIVGILGGPLGMLLGSAMGSFIGHIIDINDAKKDLSMIEQVSTKLHDGEVALIALAQESNETFLNALLSPYKTTVIRHDAAVVAAEVDEAIKVQETLAAEAREKLHALEKEKLREKIVKKGEEIRDKFKKLCS